MKVTNNKFLRNNRQAGSEEKRIFRYALPIYSEFPAQNWMIYMKILEARVKKTINIV